jgi:hypothetical protein
MPVLAPGRPASSLKPSLLVENVLEVGLWRFRLTVLDAEGNESAPADLMVKVVQDRVIEPVRDPLVRPTALDPRLVVSPTIPRPR